MDQAKPPATSSVLCVEGEPVVAHFPIGQYAEAFEVHPNAVALFGESPVIKSSGRAGARSTRAWKNGPISGAGCGADASTARPKGFVSISASVGENAYRTGSSGSAWIFRHPLRGPAHACPVVRRSPQVALEAQAYPGDLPGGLTDCRPLEQ